MTDYAAHGVAEYWIIDCEDETVEQFILEGPSYIPAQPQGHGELKLRNNWRTNDSSPCRRGRKFEGSSSTLGLAGG